MKRLLLILAIVVVLLVGLYLVRRWMNAPTPVRQFTGAPVALQLDLPDAPDARIPMVLMVSISSPRTQAALNAHSDAGLSIAVGSEKKPWWERLHITRNGSEIDYEVIEPRLAPHVALGEGETSYVFVQVESAEGRYVGKMKVNGDRYESEPLTVHVSQDLDEDELLVRKADLLLRSGDAQAALDTLKSGSQQACTIRGRALTALGRDDEAMSQYQGCLGVVDGRIPEPPTAVLDAIERLETAP